MLNLIKQAFIISWNSLPRISKVSDGTKNLSLNDEPCMVRLTLTDFNPVKLKCYPFIISLGKCNGSCNVLFPKHVFQKKEKT